MTQPGRSTLTPAVVRRALAEDREAIRAIVAALDPVVQGVARQTLRRRGLRDALREVEDITQDVLSSLFEDGGRTLRRWDPLRGSLESLVAKMAENQVADILRTRKRDPRNEIPTAGEVLDASTPAEGSGPESESSERELFHKLLLRLRAEQDARGLELVGLFLEGRPVEEICARTGMSADAVYQRRSRLFDDIHRLRAELVSENGQRPRTPREEPTS